MSRLLPASLAYFGLVFAAGFGLGVFRQLVLLDFLSPRHAELAEMPVMLIVIWFAARCVVRRYSLPRAPGMRLGTGAVALALLLAVEFTVVLWLRGLTVAESIAGRDPVSGGAYALGLVFMLLAPLLAGRRVPRS